MMKKIILSFIISCFSLAGYSQLYFSPRVNYPLPGSSTFINLTYGDYNKDGLIDIALANSSLNSISVFIGAGAGVFAPAVNYVTGTQPAGMCSFDVNGDGNPDLSVANYANNNIGVRLGNGTGTFAAQQTYGTGSGPQTPVPGDFNEDGKLDFAVANYTGNTVSILEGDGAGAFTATVAYPTGVNPQVEVRDLNNDNHLDMLVNNTGSGNMSVRMGTGTGTFGAAQNYTTGTNPRSFAFGDFNTDGIVDVLVGNVVSNTISVLTGIGDGTLNAPVNFSSQGPSTILVGDYNKDSNLDLAVSNTGNNTVSIYTGTGTGSFSLYQFTTVGSDPNIMRLLLEDVNNDNLLDIITSNDQSNVVGVLLGNTPTGNAGTALKLNGTNQSVDLGTWLNNQDFTITMWVKPGATQVTSASIIDNNYTTARSWTFQQNGSTLNQYFFNHGSSTSNVINLTADVWQHVALVSSNGDFSIYVNGQFVNSQNDGVITYDGTESLRLGRWGGGGRNWNGELDEVRFFSTALNQTQIQDGICGEIATNTTNLVAYYRINEGSGTSIYDGTTNGRTGSLINSPVFVPSGVSCFPSSIPTITSFTPASGAIGTTVTITGTNFSAVAANNIVYFGATRATVTAATPTQLTVTVPVGATYQSISVLVNGLTAFSTKPFLVTFADGGVIDACSFAPKVDFTSGTQPQSVSIGDLDRDGKPDLVVANFFGNTVSVFRNTSSVGSISYAPKVDFATGSGSLPVSIGDLDGDGKLDLAVANSSSGTISILLNTSSVGSISYAPKVDFTTGSSPFSASMGDMDGDGKADIVVANTGSNTVSVFRNTGSIGNISYATKIDFITGLEPIQASIGDLDGDGKTDLAVTNRNSNTVSVFRNTSTSVGNVSYDAKVDFTTGSRPLPVSIGDLDGDGKADLVVANYSSNTVSVFRNTSTGAGNISYASKVDFTTGTLPLSVSIDDLDGDGKADLAVANQTSNTISVFRNTGSVGILSYASKLDYTTGTTPVSVSLGDLDGDGKVDMAVANVSNNTISVLRNTVSSLPLLTISSVSPTSGPVGTLVTITGTNFSTTPVNNIVQFNSTTAVVTASTPNSITTTVPTGATTGKISITVGCNTEVSTNNFTVSTINQPPIIEPTTTAVPIEGIITLNLETLISDPDNNLDPTSLYLVNSVSEQGASASLDDEFMLTLDYGGVQFFGTDRITIGVCDLLAECAEQELTIEVGGDIVIYNALSPNGDGKNEIFILQYIDILPETLSNKVTILNRWGDVVFEIDNYDNDARAFRGVSDNGKDLPSGIYYYKIEFTSGLKTKTGYLSLRR